VRVADGVHAHPLDPPAVALLEHRTPASPRRRRDRPPRPDGALGEHDQRQRLGRDQRVEHGAVARQHGELDATGELGDLERGVVERLRPAPVAPKVGAPRGGVGVGPEGAGSGEDDGGGLPGGHGRRSAGRTNGRTAERGLTNCNSCM
jgi:hypothetical protein